MVDLVQNRQKDPAQRMSANQILKYPLLQDTDEVEKRQLLLDNKSLKHRERELEHRKRELELRERVVEHELEAARKEIADLRAQIQRLNSTSS